MGYQPFRKYPWDIPAAFLGNLQIILAKILPRS